MNDLDAAKAVIKSKPNTQKVALLSALLEWANTDEGMDYRAGLAHSGLPSPLTLADVFAVLPDDVQNEVTDCMVEHELNDYT